MSAKNYRNRVALYSRSLDIQPPKSPETRPVCQPPTQPVPVTAAVCSLSVEVEPTSLLLKVCHNKLRHLTPLLLKPVSVVAIPRESHLLGVQWMDRETLCRLESNDNATANEMRKVDHITTAQT